MKSKIIEVPLAQNKVSFICGHAYLCKDGSIVLCTANDSQHSFRGFCLVESNPLCSGYDPSDINQAGDYSYSWQKSYFVEEFHGKIELEFE